MNTVAQPAERYRALIEQAGAGLAGRQLDWLEIQRELKAWREAGAK